MTSDAIRAAAFAQQAPDDVQHMSWRLGFIAGAEWAQKNASQPANLADLTDLEIVSAWFHEVPNVGVAYFDSTLKERVARIRALVAKYATRSEPQEGEWILAEDVNELAHQLDVAWNGESGAAEKTSLCAIVAQIIRESRSEQPRMPSREQMAREIMEAPRGGSSSIPSWLPAADAVLALFNASDAESETF